MPTKTYPTPDFSFAKITEYITHRAKVTPKETVNLACPTNWLTSQMAREFFGLRCVASSYNSVSGVCHKSKIYTKYEITPDFYSFVKSLRERKPSWYELQKSVTHYSKNIKTT